MGSMGFSSEKKSLPLQSFSRQVCILHTLQNTSSNQVQISWIYLNSHYGIMILKNTYSSNANTDLLLPNIVQSSVLSHTLGLTCCLECHTAACFWWSAPSYKPRAQVTLTDYVFCNKAAKITQLMNILINYHYHKKG